MLQRKLGTGLLAIAISIYLSCFAQSAAALGKVPEKWLIYVLESQKNAAYYLLSVEVIPSFVDGVPSTEYSVVEGGRPDINESYRTVAVVLASVKTDFSGYFCQVSHTELVPSTQGKLVPLPGVTPESGRGTSTIDFTSTAEVRKRISDSMWQVIGTKTIKLGDDEWTIDELDKADKLRALQCEVHTKDRGGDFKVMIRKEGNTRAHTILEDRFEVHHLYSFRLMAGPVFSSLKTQNRDFSVITNNNGQSIISSSTHSSYPVNYPVFLKVYWKEQDIQMIPDCMKSKHIEDWLNLMNNYDWYGCLQRLNPIIGVNLIDNPLEHFYTGASFEVVRGADLVGGVEWAKVQRLTGGFFDGQNVTGMGVTNPPTRRRFEGGYFVGVTVDLGILGTWLNNTIGQGISTLYPSR